MANMKATRFNYTWSLKDVKMGFSIRISENHLPMSSAVLYNNGYVVITAGRIVNFEDINFCGLRS